jgi:F-type H+-transporting ATPase subunit b
MLELNGTLFVQLINFIVFLSILNVIFMKPVGAAIARRRAYIEGVTHDIEELQGSVNDIRRQAEADRLAARREAEEAIARARGDAAKEADAQIVAAQSQAAKIVAEAHAEVGREVASARAEEPRLVDALANELVARAIGGTA